MSADIPQHLVSTPLHPSPVPTEAQQSAVQVAADGTLAALLPRRWRRPLALLLPLWFLLALAWLAPAQLVSTLLRAPLPQLQLGSVSGSLWHGRAASAQWRDSRSAIALGVVEWRIAPWSLLLLQPRLQISAEYGEQFAGAVVTLSPLGKVTLRDLRAAVPATSLRALAPLPVDGQVTMQLQQLTLQLGGTVETVAGELQWQRAAWQWERRWLALGDYRCLLGSETVGQLRCELAGGSAAQVDGIVDIDLAQRRYRINTMLQLSDELPTQLRDGAGLLLGGNTEGDGRWHIEREGGW